MRMTRVVSVLVFGLCFYFSGATLAQETEEGKDPVVWLDVGVKGGVSGYYLKSSTEGDDSIPGISLPYEKGAGGLGGGFGFFLDFQILKKHLSLEADLFFDNAKIWSTITWNDVLEVDYITRYSTLRVPILLKGSLVRGPTRVSLGVGPEFVIGRKARADIEVVDGQEYWNDAAQEQADENFNAKSRSDVFFCVDLGMGIDIWKLLLTLDLRLSFNPGLPEDYEDRMEINASSEPNQSEFINTASHSLDLHILLGLAYPFGFPL